MRTSLRMFVALVPPEEALEDLEGFLASRRAAAEFRWATPEQFHVTLAFLASVADRHVDELAERLTRAAQRRAAFPTRLAGGGAFPNAGRAMVLWTGLELTEPDAAELRRLAAGCRAAAARTGIAVGGQRFKPHVTLARLGRPTEVSNWVKLLDTYAGPAWTADRISLVASYLGEGPAGRPRYETVEEFPLAPPRPGGSSGSPGSPGSSG